MNRMTASVTLVTTAFVALPALGGQWVNYNNETSTRMPVGPDLNTASLSTTDVEEKDYAWGDIDNDGDIDLVCVRKQPFTSTGKEANVLFMNEGVAEGHAVNGVLVDRTSTYAFQSNISGDQGFLTPTNDRDVVLVDVNGDGWLDVVTATTLTDNQAKHLSHPRVYINLGEQGGVWRGLRYEDARIPSMHPNAGPRFCSVAFGDLTGNGAPDLYFGDYDSGGSQISDYNNKLLINDGNGFFADESDTRLTSEMRLSAFGAASVIADINNDGALDAVKQTSLNAPTHVAITYNDPGNEGFFDRYDTIYSLAPYFVTAGDLNNDGNLDLVITDDGTDRYMIAGSLDGQGQRNWTELTLPAGPSGGFGSNSLIVDLDQDGLKDILIADVDVDIAGCSRQLQIYKNLGGSPNPSFNVIGEVIPNSMLTGTHDMAVFDINGDGWDDMVIGRCTGTQVWINDPPVGITFSYPNGVPAFVSPGATTDLDVQLGAIGGGTPDANSAVLFTSVDGGSFTQQSMNNIGGDMVRGQLPALACTSNVRFYVRADLQGGGQGFDPPGAPGAFYTAIAAEGTEITLRDEVEGSVASWSTTNEGATSGAWEAADPNGTINNGNLANPEDDATAGADNVTAWVTANGAPGESAGTNDVDGGPVRLLSPTFDLDGADATISFSRWLYCDDAGTADADFMTVEISNNGGSSWTSVPPMTTGDTGSAWEIASFVVSDYIAPTANMRVRWTVADAPNNSVTEGGVDNFQIEEIVCGADCPTDVDGSGATDFNDLVALLAGWGPCGDCPEDVDGSGAVDFNDIVVMLAAWGDC